MKVAVYKYVNGTLAMVYVLSGQLYCHINSAPCLRDGDLRRQS